MFVFKWHLFIGCGTSPSSNINLNVVAHNRREVMYPVTPRPLRSRARDIAQATANARGGLRFVFNWCLCVVSVYNFTNL